MTREEYCIAQSIIAAIRNISSLYEAHEDISDDVPVNESLQCISDKIKEETGIMQRENMVDFSKWWR